MVEFYSGMKRFLKPGIGQLGTYAPRAIKLFPSEPVVRDVDYVWPTISIVIPSLNQGRFLEDTLKSIIDQRYPKLELIVVDGGSTDNTLDVIKQYEDHITWWISEPDSGQAAAINKGFRKSSGEIMAWINSDDLIAPGALQKVVQYFSNNPAIDVVYGDRIVINEQGHEIGRWTLPRHSCRILKWADFVPQETLYWTRAAWKAVDSQLDESFAFAMDWDFLLRLSRNNIPMRHMRAYLGLFRVHSTQKTSRQIHSIGREEIQKIRSRELGFEPTQWQITLNTISFLISAKFCEVRARVG